MTNYETKSMWNNPATIISLLTLLLSLGTNIFQYYNSKEQIKIAKEKSEAEIYNLKAQVKQWELEAESKAKLIKIKEEDNLIIREELEKIDNEISKWEKSILDQTFEVQNAQGDLDRAITKGKNEQIEIDREYLNKIKGTLEYSKNQLEYNKTRKKELENKLSQ